MVFFHTTPSGRRRALFRSRRNQCHTKQGSRVISFRSDILDPTRLVQLEDSREGVKVHGRLNLDTAAMSSETGDDAGSDLKIDEPVNALWPWK